MTHAKVQAILDQHAAVFSALRDASYAFDHAIDGLNTAMHAIRDANHQQGRAIDAALAANQAALTLLTDDAEP